MGNERKKINLTDIDEDSIVASFKEDRQTDGQAQAAGNNGQSDEENGYVRLFIHESSVCARLGKTIYLRKEFHERIQKIVQTIGNNEMSIFSYVDNVLEQHFSTYQDEIILTYRRLSAVDSRLPLPRAEQPEEESGKSRADPYPDGGGRERDFRQKHIFP